jgi:RecJ-like exonuclease
LAEYDAFKKFAADEAKNFKAENVKIVSHLDSDGIASAAILIKLCGLLGINSSTSIIPQLSQDEITKISLENNETVIFSDIGSNHASQIKQKIKNAVILDHHKPDSEPRQNHINPHFFGIDGSSEISGAGVAYLFAKSAHEGIKEYAHLALIGAIGDMQEKNGFTGLNKEILEDALNSKKIRIEKGLKIFGLQTRPIHKLLEYSSDFNLPGITGSDAGAVKFLHKIGIKPMIGKKWKKFGDLTGEEINKLVSGLIAIRKKEKNPESIVGTRYLLIDERCNSPFYDLKEFSTLLNGCGRLKKYSPGIGACLGDEKAKHSAVKALLDYKKEIKDFMQWFKDNRKKEMITEENNYVIINAKEEVPCTMIGTMSSIISRSRLVNPGTCVLGLARQADKTKVSLRIPPNTKITSAREMLKEIAESVGGEAGGHQLAAGAVIETAKEEEFIKKAKEKLKACS